MLDKRLVTYINNEVKKESRDPSNNCYIADHRSSEGTRNNTHDQATRDR